MCRFDKLRAGSGQAGAPAGRAIRGAARWTSPSSTGAATGRSIRALDMGLALEYEAACRDPVQRMASGLSEAEVGTVVPALCAVAEPVTTRFLWRPQLRDAADEMVLEAAINGNADALVTFNRRGFGTVPERFGIALLSPREALRRVSS